MRPAAQGARYALVTGFCLTTHNAIMIVADRLGRTLPVAIALSFCTVVVIGYLLHSRYTFAAARGWKAFFLYILAMAVNLPLSAASIWLFAKALAWPMVLASPAASCCLIAVNFSMSRWAICRPASRAVAIP